MRRPRPPPRIRRHFAATTQVPARRRAGSHLRKRDPACRENGAPLPRAFLGACLLALAIAPAQAGTILSPVGAAITAGGPGAGAIADTFNQRGRSAGFTSGVTDFAGYLATNPTHTILRLRFEWFSEEVPAASVTCDLGAVSRIAALALWNEESPGIGRLDLAVSGDGVAFAPLASGLAPFDNPFADYPAEIFAFAPTAFRFIRFDMSNCPQPNPGSFAGCAIGEVAFERLDDLAGVPGPAALGVFGLGLLGLAVLRRHA